MFQYRILVGMVAHLFGFINYILPLGNRCRNCIDVLITIINFIFKAVESSGTGITASVSAGSCEQSQAPTVATSTGGVLSMAVVGMSMYRRYLFF